MKLGAATSLTPTSREGTLLAIGHALASLLARADLTELAAATTAATARLGRGALTIAILGEFKRGKSSLINALIGRDLLPVGALPLTSVETRLQFRDAVQVVVEFLDGQSLQIEPVAIADYATERGNPGNRRRVASITVSAPAPVLRTHLHLVDTPGIGSAFADVTATARACLAQADAALVVLSAEQPASRHELDFLRETLSAGAPTFVIENKIDLVPAAERDDVITFVRTQIRQLREGANVPLFAVSSDQARRAQRAADTTALTASGIPALEAALLAFTQREGSAVLARAARRRLLRIIEQAVAARQLRSRAVPLADFWHEQRQARLRQQVNIVLLRDLLDATERSATVADDIERGLGRQAANAAAERWLDAFLGSVPIESGGQSVRRWAVDLDTRLRGELDAVINQWSDAERDRLSAAGQDVADGYRARIAEALSPILGAPPPVELPALDFPPPTVALPATHLTWPMLLPGSIGRRQARRRARRRLQATLPALLEARRSVISQSIVDTLKRAEERWHERVMASLDQILAQAAVSPTAIDAADDPIDPELQQLRRQLCEDGDAC